jgi:hypothetical protein
MSISELRWDEAVRLTFDETKLDEIVAKKGKDKERAGDFTQSLNDDDYEDD